MQHIQMKGEKGRVFGWVRAQNKRAGAEGRKMMKWSAEKQWTAKANVQQHTV